MRFGARLRKAWQPGCGKQKVRRRNPRESTDESRRAAAALLARDSPGPAGDVAVAVAARAWHCLALARRACRDLGAHGGGARAARMAAGKVCALACQYRGTPRAGRARRTRT